MARNNLNVVKISARQDEISIEEEVIMTVSDFNIQQQLIASAEEALDLSILAYNETKQRFICLLYTSMYLRKLLLIKKI